MRVCKVCGRRAPAGLVLACAAVVALSAASGCIRPILPGVPGFGMDTLNVRQPRDHGRRGELIQVSEKAVGGKEEPSTLIAEDASRCTVTKRRYQRTRIGERTLCAWRRDDRAP